MIHISKYPDLFEHCITAEINYTLYVFDMEQIQREAEREKTEEQQNSSDVCS